jgi:flagellar assembly protein FliH
MSDQKFNAAGQGARNAGFSDLYDMAKSEGARGKQPAVAPETIKAILEKAYRDGYERGTKEGYQAGMAQARQVLEAERLQLLNLANTFKCTLDQHSDEFAVDVIGLSLDIAKVMTKKHIQVDELAILPIVREAIEALPLVKKPLQLCINPLDAAMVSKLIDKEFEDIGWSIVERTDIDRGGCMIETAFNTVDASNALRWKRIAEALEQSNAWHEREEA